MATLVSMAMAVVGPKGVVVVGLDAEVAEQVEGSAGKAVAVGVLGAYAVASAAAATKVALEAEA